MKLYHQCTLFLILPSFFLILSQRVSLAVPLPTPYFSMVNAKTGLAGVGPFHKISVVDVNGDGYPDLLMHKAINETSPNDSDVVDHQYLYLNVPGDDPNDPHSRKFVDFTAQSGIRAKRSGASTGRHSSFAVFADVDNDGDLDMFSGVFSVDLSTYKDRGDRNDLFLNDGSGHFSFAPSSALNSETLGKNGLMNTAGATFLDYDNDGNIDLFIGNWLMAGVGSSVGTRGQLYRGDGKGRFTNVTKDTGISLGYTIPSYAVAAADWNNDGHMDIFENDYCRQKWPHSSIHWKNNGNGTFSQVQDTTNYGKYINESNPDQRDTCSFGSMPRDYDNDGDIDLFELIVHGDEARIHSTILTNNQNVFSWDFDKIKRPTDAQSGHYRDLYGSWFDIDNDGLADFILSSSGPDTANRLTLFQQSASHTFNIVSNEAGFGTLNASNKLRFHYVIPLDYDLDGDEDLLIGFADNNEIQLWQNDIGTSNNWLTLALKGAGKPGLSNRSAIGARVEVTAGGKTYTREIYAGNGQFGPQVPLSLTFGLGQATKVDHLKIRWPNQNHSVSEFTDVAINQFLKIEEGSSSSENLIRGKENPAKCFHKKYGGWANGNPIHIWDCAAGSEENKTWIYEANTGYIRGKLNPSKCLHKKTGGWTNGDPIHVWDCAGGSAENKTWIIDTNSSEVLIKGKENPTEGKLGHP